jgi:hypothetical protein
MRLDDFQQERVGRFTRYSAPLSDDTGEQAYQLLLVGLDERIRESAGESEIEATINSRVEREEWEASLARTLGLTDQVVPVDAFDDLDGLFKRPAPEPTAEDSVVCVLRREKPGGSSFTVDFSGLFVPPGFSIFFVFPLAFACAAASLPSSGDPDLFLTLNSPSGPLVSSSVLPSRFPDFVFFMTPAFFQFFPFVRVFGFAIGVTRFIGSSVGAP